MNKNLNMLIQEIDLSIGTDEKNKNWYMSAKKLIIDNYEENISIEKLELKINNWNIENDKDRGIRALALAILSNIRTSSTKKEEEKNMNLNDIFRYLDKYISSDFLLNYYQDEILKKDIISKQIYIFNKDNLLLKSKPLHISESFAKLETWVPLDDISRNYQYDKNSIKIEFKTIKIKPTKKIKIKDIILIVYLFTNEFK